MVNTIDYDAFLPRHESEPDPQFEKNREHHAECACLMQSLHDVPYLTGFDLLSYRPDGEKRAIEVKGRAKIGAVDVTANEWARACNEKDRYWLFVVYDCAAPNPRLHRIQNPFGKLLAKQKGSVTIGQGEIVRVSEQ
jgi:hypothetical protein